MTDRYRARRMFGQPGSAGPAVEHLRSGALPSGWDDDRGSTEDRLRDAISDGRERREALNQAGQLASLGGGMMFRPRRVLSRADRRAVPDLEPEPGAAASTCTVCGCLINYGAATCWRRDCRVKFEARSEDAGDEPR